ncbi:MAG: pyruvate dehydrogenase complex dihydrolipoamide acetyltransferase [Candidatus Palauibacterales bacterium]|nr:pyruvate dehydrogenase complex dihydrolipoamide acetyltransferase [Candidatus Palauibacterales bacterium]MDP2530399.1 pyruvate dehydrogenase complex dihydrolipoamide acetyltransferase [Candidatus Palauibacterales bacterium]MDP2585085.1 pyruvate dehydrogenase complex dihydrolipoamide acetyltransferase [Candidatus Palauibacterales bacterium]
MATKVVMAQLSPTMEEGRLVEWKISEGDVVQQGDVVAEIETDKANMDVEALGSGVLRKIVVQEGETVPVGALIGVIAGEDEDIETLLREAEAEAGAAGDEGEAVADEKADNEGTAAEEEPGEEVSREPARAGASAGEASADAAADDGGGRRDGGRLRASPVARRMAEEEGLDLSRIEGSGPGGRIVKADVEGALESGAAVSGGRAAAGSTRLADETIQLSQMRKAIARRLTQSLGPVPHFFLTTEIDMGRALELRAELNEQIGGGEAGAPKVGVNDLLLKAAAEALVRHPEINASWGEGEIRRHGRVDLGIAVALDDGLITPVLRDADRKGLVRIASEATELIDRARRRKLDPDEYQGATFSISNLGMFPIEEFTAIINPPEAAILAVGRTAEKPVVVDGEVVVRRRMRVTMSCDHRVIDGATGARFLETFKGMLENPLAMLA